MYRLECSPEWHDDSCVFNVYNPGCACATVINPDAPVLCHIEVQRNFAGRCFLYVFSKTNYIPHCLPPMISYRSGGGLIRIIKYHSLSCD